MGVDASEVRRMSLSDFFAAVQGHNEMHGAAGGMSKSEALQLRAELWEGEDA